MRISERARERFLSGVAAGAADECWQWQRSRTGSGYGQIMIDGAMQYAHRVAFELHRGPIPDGAMVCHRCDVRTCCNPAHLFIGDHTDNMRDMAAKGRQWLQRAPQRARGSGNSSAKLTESDVTFIRDQCRNGRTQQSMARRFGVSATAIYQIVTRKHWRHIP